MTADATLAPCGECGMPCTAAEHHPYAACLMFKACQNSDTVRANLEAVRAQATAPHGPALAPLTDEQCDAIAQALDQWGRERDVYEYGLPVSLDEPAKEWRGVIRNAAQEAPNGKPT